MCLEYCGTRAVPTVETSDYLITLGNKLNPKINIMWTGKSFLWFNFVTLPFLLIYYWWMLVLLSTCPVSFSSVGEGQILACFFYAWLKVQLHLSFSFPASQPVFQNFTTSDIHGFLCTVGLLVQQFKVSLTHDVMIMMFRGSLN